MMDATLPVHEFRIRAWLRHDAQHMQHPTYILSALVY